MDFKMNSKFFQWDGALYLDELRPISVCLGPWKMDRPYVQEDTEVYCVL